MNESLAKSGSYTLKLVVSSVNESTDDENQIIKIPVMVIKKSTTNVDFDVDVEIDNSD